MSGRYIKLITLGLTYKEYVALTEVFQPKPKCKLIRLIWFFLEAIPKSQLRRENEFDK